VVFVGGQYFPGLRLFESCTQVGRLDNRLHVENEEQGQPIGICRNPRMPWVALWEELKHLD
jgi:hypothetical protein